MSRDLLGFFRAIAALKRTPRTGWLDRGVAPPEVESVADHTLQTALIAWTLALDDPALDAGRVLQLAVVHDLAEAIVGDQPPYGSHDIPRDDPEALRAFFSVRHVRTPENRGAKLRAEADAAARLVAMLPDNAAATISDLWDEYEARATPEARFVKEVDTLEAFLQSRAYLRTDPALPVEGFADMARKELSHPALVGLRDAELAEEM
jgi:putative hydrolase of HD superfamily